MSLSTDNCGLCLCLQVLCPCLYVRLGKKNIISYMYVSHFFTKWQSIAGNCQGTCMTVRWDSWGHYKLAENRRMGRSTGWLVWNVPCIKQVIQFVKKLVLARLKQKCHLIHTQHMPTPLLFVTESGSTQCLSHLEYIFRVAYTCTLSATEYHLYASRCDGLNKHIFVQAGYLKCQNFSYYKEYFLIFWLYH